jgi:hypothetical protein
MPGLGDQQPVERVAMPPRQMPNLERMGGDYGQLAEACFIDDRREPVERKRQLAQAALDGDLPNRRRADDAALMWTM